MNPALYQLSYAAALGTNKYTIIGVIWANGKGPLHNATAPDGLGRPNLLLGTPPMIWQKSLAEFNTTARTDAFPEAA